MEEQLRAADRRCAAPTDDETTSDIRQHGGQRNRGFRRECKAQDSDDDAAWTAQHFRHKPGDVARAPDFVAPHQPRVDFRLWFYGLAFQRRMPAYVSALLERLCGEPEIVQPLFRAPLPPHPTAVRLVFWQYQFTPAAEKRASGAWWGRTRLATLRAVPCAQVPDPR